MPLYYFKCSGPCGTSVTDFLTPAEAKKPRHCPKPDCGGVFVRTPKAPSSQVMERLDNGWMAKAIERPADAERLFKERSKIDPLKDS